MLWSLARRIAGWLARRGYIHNNFVTFATGYEPPVSYAAEGACFPRRTARRIAIQDNEAPFKHIDKGIDQHKLVFKKATELMKAIVLSPVPVIAKVNGFATAAGCQLVATCDMIVCSDTSKFSTPGANFGIFCSTPGIAVGRSVPKSQAMYMLLTGEPLTAQQAYESGLVTKVVPANQLDEEVNKIVEKIKLKSRSVIGLGKQFYYKQIELGIFDAYKLGEEIMVKNINADDGQEGIRSFVEKRKANWSHT
ncbi:enoyl-CoA hydratase domain-containing protein 3, mitochondrial-like isoform X2 [Hyposmocoma kahamanoa]|uniref:enoyl-CoA hydratase domain-containing protein 3, mitochondrial-like isoform X2 n=1 Tax=Hyposmocoma kahamanoa TaxID=1477025 RepID=UPI000E6D9074|nr:enoyl-CoA hydratase domain-containing protein 3, mitochondrial-like isoform X2 [Hyposmocoma kahamanoa]